VKVESVPPAAGRVFISYRRRTACRLLLFDRLVDQFGRSRSSGHRLDPAPAMTSLSDHCRGRSCDVLLALIR
jgi:hypothetical protein